MDPCQYCTRGTYFAICRDCNEELNDSGDRAYDEYREREFDL